MNRRAPIAFNALATEYDELIASGFDLTQRRFAPWYMQFCLTHGLRHDRYLAAPHHLFAEAK